VIVLLLQQEIDVNVNREDFIASHSDGAIMPDHQEVSGKEKEETGPLSAAVTACRGPGAKNGRLLLVKRSLGGDGYQKNTLPRGKPQRVRTR
jgi:hypothetical protein